VHGNDVYRRVLFVYDVSVKAKVLTGTIRLDEGAVY